MMTNKSILGELITSFIEKYLCQEVGSPATTVSSYATAIKLLLVFSCQHLKKSIEALSLKDINAPLVLAFLDHLEKDRGNLPQTRNNRLAALCTFVRYLAREDPLMVTACTRICAIRPKKVTHKVMPSLSKEEVEAFLSAIPRTNLAGLRDYALFLLLHNTGARVTEAMDLEINDLRLEKPYQVSLIGKGGKQRIVPIWAETARAIGTYLKGRKHLQDESLFLNNKGQSLTRFGVGYLTTKYWLLAQQSCPSLADIKVTPHTFRHTCAFQSIESGNSITTVQDWLGHAHINTTRLYFSLSIEMKRKALKSFTPPIDHASSDEIPKWQQPEILQFLDNLSRSQARNLVPPSLRAPPRPSV